MWIRSLIVMLVLGCPLVSYAASVSGGGGGASSLDQAFDGGQEIDSAYSETNSVRIGDGIRKTKKWCDATSGCVEKPDPLADTFWPIWPNFNGCIKDMEANSGLGANMLCVDPDAASTNLMYQFQTGYNPIGSIAPALYPRGAATGAEESIVTNQPRMYYLTLTDVDTDAADFSFLANAKLNGAATATFRLVGVSKHASPSGDIALDCAMTSFTPGTDTFTAHSTTGQVRITLTPSVQNRPVAATSSAHTINGGPIATGDVVYGSCEIDATATTSTQLSDFRLRGDVLIQLQQNSLSD